jgi:hypothetical protein
MTVNLKSRFRDAGERRLNSSTDRASIAPPAWR